MGNISKTYNTVCFFTTNSNLLYLFLFSIFRQLSSPSKCQALISPFYTPCQPNSIKDIRKCNATHPWVNLIFRLEVILYYLLIPTVILTAKFLLLKIFAYIILIITLLYTPPRILLTTLDIPRKGKNISPNLLLE